MIIGNNESEITVPLIPGQNLGVGLKESRK